MSEVVCRECGTSGCRRTRVNPYCSVTVYVRCEGCGSKRTVSGMHECGEV